MLHSIIDMTINSQTEMITINLNGEQKKVPIDCLVIKALTQWGYRPHTIAVAINGEFVPRSEYSQQQLFDGDAIEVVAPIEGG